MSKDKKKVSNSYAFQGRREKLKQLIIEIGPWNINKTALAKQFKVHRNTIANDYKKVMETLTIEDIQEISVAISTALKGSLKQSHFIMGTSKDTKEILDAVNSVGKASERLTRYLEDFGKKAKTPEEHHHTGYPLWEDPIDRLEREKLEKRKSKKGKKSKK